MSYNVILDRLHRLYPHLSREDVIGKVEQSDDNSFLFFRAFVPLFYQLLRRSNSLTTLPIGDASFNCWCVGDPHLENFGVLIANQEAAPNSRIFAMNDPDDGALNYPAADLLRFLTGIYLAKPFLRLEAPLTIEGKLDDAIEAYENALTTGEAPANSADVRTFLRETHNVRRGSVDELLEQGNEINENYVSRTGRFHLVKKDDEDVIYGFRVAAAEEEAIEDLFQDLFPGEFKVCDIRKFKKKNGGSGGLLQFRVLLRPSGSRCSRRPDTMHSSDVMVIELKPLVRSGVFPLMRQEDGDDWQTVPEKDPNDLPLADARISSSMDPKAIVDRVNNSLDNERGVTGVRDRFSRALYQRELGPVLVRPQWRGDNGVKMEELIKDGNRDLIEAEAAILGIIHRKSLGERIVDYKDAFSQPETKTQLLSDSETLAETIKNIFTEANKGA